MGQETELEPQSVIIENPANNAYSRNSDIDVSGTTPIQLPIVVRMFKDNVQVAIETASLQSNRWSTRIKGTYAPGPYRIEVTQSGSVNRTVNLRVTPVAITAPPSGVVPNRQFMVSGNGGEYGVGTITLHNAAGNGLLGTAAIQANGNWTASVTLPNESQPLTFNAKQKIGTYFSPNSTPVTVMLLVRPTITTPANAAVTDPRGLIAGGNAASGAIVEVLKDLEHSFKIGHGTAGADGRWSVTTFNQDMPPGSFAIVARQTIQGVKSDVSLPRGFKIRPPKLTNIKTEFLTTPVAGVKFSGGGHNGATVEITVVSGPGGTAPPAVQVRNGQWETTATNWTFGTYKLSAVQKVPDNANGWILSQPYTFDVVRAVPAPTNVKCTVDARTPIFTGNGENGATIVITDAAGGSVDVPDASVTAGTWSTRARAPWAPVNSRSIKVVQKVGTPTSVPVEIKVTIENLAPPTEVAYSVTDYTPTFTGKGIVGATIHVLDAGDKKDVAPPVLLTNPSWSTRASTRWGPTRLRKVTVVHKKDGLTSAAVERDVTIPLLAPDITRVTVDELQAQVAGTCWAGAVVTLKFSDSAVLHTLSVNNGTWVFKRPTPFTPGADYTVTATQTFADLGPSLPASKNFTIKLPTPRITGPDDKADVWRDFTVKGDKGYKGATMQLRDAQFGWDLGAPKVLTEDGEWSIDLSGLEFRRYTIDAQQTLNQRESERSESRVFEVVLVPPIITMPMENGDLPRTSTLSGWAMPGGRVVVWLKDVAKPLLENIPVIDDGRWKAEVTLPVGAKTIWARQTFEGRTSKDSQPLNYNVVPAAPFIETPALGEHIGRRVVVSGFGVAGDSVTVRLGNVAQTVLGRSPVLVDRTWSVTVEFDQLGGLYPLVAVASSEGFDSADSVVRPVVLGTYRPSVDVPAQGQWVSHPVGFKGKGRPGVGQVVSWFSPDHVWAPDLSVTGGGWQGGAQQSLPRGGQWCRFRQSITDSADGATVSDWVESKRFESEPPTAES